MNHGQQLVGFTLDLTKIVQNCWYQKAGGLPNENECFPTNNFNFAEPTWICRQPDWSQLNVDPFGEVGGFPMTAIHLHMQSLMSHH